MKYLLFFIPLLLLSCIEEDVAISNKYEDLHTNVDNSEWIMVKYESYGKTKMIHTAGSGDSIFIVRFENGNFEYHSVVDDSIYNIFTSKYSFENDTLKGEPFERTNSKTERFSIAKIVSDEQFGLEITTISDTVIAGIQMENNKKVITLVPYTGMLPTISMRNMTQKNNIANPIDSPTFGL